jgi:hypothetical protein
MNAIAGTCSDHAALQESYREALLHWAAVRALTPSDANAILEATQKLEALELSLKAHRLSHGC